MDATKRCSSLSFCLNILSDARYLYCYLLGTNMFNPDLNPILLLANPHQAKLNRGVSGKSQQRSRMNAMLYAYSVFDVRLHNELRKEADPDTPSKCIRTSMSITTTYSHLSWKNLAPLPFPMPRIIEGSSLSSTCWLFLRHFSPILLFFVLQSIHEPG